MMAKKKIRFTAGFAVIVAAVAYFAIAGFQEGKAYYRTIDELEQLGPSAHGKRLRVAGLVKPGTISRTGNELAFTLEQDALTLNVVYNGSAPVPDTFKDGAEAIVEGVRQNDGTFEADQIQAKCASKYEAEYGKDAKHPESVQMN
jgi:cytochrome c-type biogenesis protein CcmE